MGCRLHRTGTALSVETIPATGNRFEALDALRGVCALLVALFHFESPGIIGNLGFVRNAYLFVDYFFVLSGFVIAHSYGQKLASRSIGVGRFMLLRLGRIYPLHLAMLLAYLSLDLLSANLGDLFAGLTSRVPFSEPRTLPELLSNLLLLQSFGIHQGTTWNGPSWSIAAEAWCYLLFATVVVLAIRRWWLSMGILAGLALVLLILSRRDIDATFNMGFVRSVYGFGLGVLVHRIYRAGIGQGGTLLELGALVGVLLFVSLAKGEWTFLAPLIFASTLLVASQEQGVVTRALRSKPLLFSGTISYSIYMVHAFYEARFVQILKAVAPALTATNSHGELVIGGGRLTGDLLTLAMLAGLILVSWISYQLIERPGRELSRKLLVSTFPRGSGLAPGT